jgi:hypothetical protein
MASIPLQRSKAWLEEKGWRVWIVEYWHAQAHVRRDLYGFGDLVAIRHDLKGVWCVNACEDNGEVQAHVKKFLNGFVYESGKKMGQSQPPNAHLPVWLAGCNRFSIMGWGKRSSEGRGSRQVWKLRMVEFYLDGPEVKWKEVADVEA